MKFATRLWSWLKQVVGEENGEVLAELIVGSVVIGLFLGVCFGLVIMTTG